MSTVHKLITDGMLEPYSIEGYDRRAFYREIYATREMVSWFDEVLPKLKADRSQISPLEQVDDLLERFVCGNSFIFNDDLKVLKSLGPTVWAMRTTDVRLFGFFHAPSCFIAVIGEAKSRLQQFAQYRPFIEKVHRSIDALDLDDPKYVVGATKADVL